MDAGAAIRHRLATRCSTFLNTIEHVIFSIHASPYRCLLDAAGYDLPRIRLLVDQRGVDETLRVLAQDGVYVAIEEFKGLREAHRGVHRFRFKPEDFRNPLAGPGMRLSSGGTRSTGISTLATVATVRITAEHLAVMLAALGVEDSPTAVWFTQAHGVAMIVVLCLAMSQQPPRRWIKQLPERYGSSQETYAHFLGIKAGARLNSIILPLEDYVPVGAESSILPWVGERARECGYVVYTTPSRALRLALAARREAIDLSHVTFLVRSEPLTPAKLAAIRDVGARAFSIFGSTETGAAAYGCVSPASADDMHVCDDVVAVVQRQRLVDDAGSNVGALLFTGIRDDAGRVLLNMETGDYARLTRRTCGCPLEALGWTHHLEEVRSFEKLTPEGGTFLGSKLIELFEETLPARFGGDPTDYQLVEHEDGEGFTRLTVLVHPRLDSVDEDGILECVERMLEPDDDAMTRFYKHAGTLRLCRKIPMMTGAGKVMTLHRPSPGQFLDGHQTEQSLKPRETR